MPGEAANGKFDKLSKGAFDTDAVNHGSGWQQDLQTFATSSFDTGVKGLLSKFGMNEQMISKLGSVGTSDFIESMWGVGSDLLTAGLSSVLGDGLSLLFDAGKAGFDLFTKGGSRRDFNFKRGEWVIIDNGPAPTVDSPFSTSEGRPNSLSGKEWEQSLEISSRRRMGFAFEGERDVSPGFYVGPGKEENTVTVFNFRYWRDSDIFITQVNLMPKGEAAKLDKDELISEIRALKFQQDECKLVNSNVPTNPGTEVLLDDVRYHVVTSAGQSVTIEDEWGTQKIVDISLLKRGRTSHTEVFNYRADGSVTGGFVGSGEDSIYSGRWLWVSARDLGYPAGRELVCVEYIHNSIHVFYALDGERGKFDESEVSLVSEEFNSLFCANKQFVEFQSFAQSGYDMKRVSLGKTYPLLCIGVTNTSEGQTKTRMAEEDACDTVYSRLEKAIGRVGDLDLHKELDNARERGVKDESPNQQAYEVVGDDEVDPEPEVGSSHSFLMMGGALAIAALLLNSVG